MKLKKEFLLHNSDGNSYLIPTSEAKFKGMVKGNKTMGVILELLKEDTTEDSMIDKLLTEYSGADRETVRRDVSAVIEKLKGIGAIE